MARSQIGRILTRQKVNLAANGSRVRLTWQEYTGTPTTEPTTGARTGTTVEQSVVLSAHLHFPDPAGYTVKLFNEVEVGDCLAVFAADAPLKQAGVNTATTDAVPESARFQLLDADGADVPGELYVAKPLGEALAQAWDVRQQGHALHRTVLLRKAT
jgi:hypothetical protein